MKGRIFLLSLFVLGLFATTSSQTFAVTPPDFPACSSQIGAPKIASYTNGVHGIPGDTKTYTGSDTVYAIDGTNKVLQCFCAENGIGIQTTWWKASSLSDAEIKVLVSQGWNHIVNGSAWGLANEPYIAKNSEYACSRGMGGGYMEDTKETILGLAGTGNTKFLYNLFLFAVATTGVGILLTRFSRNSA